MERLVERPSFIPAPSKRTRGSKAEGLAYEGKIARYLAALYGGRALHNPWFRFVDAIGEGWCSPDVLVLPKGDEPGVLFECKLTAVANVVEKIDGLYLPVVRAAFPEVKGWRAVQVCKNLRRGFEGYLINSAKSAVDPNAEWTFATWNFQKPPR